MKNLSAILFVILFLAVAVLFFFQFKGGKKGSANTPANAQTENATAGIAYVNIDTVVFKFNIY